jgi:hypothetical protein
MLNLKKKTKMNRKKLNGSGAAIKLSRAQKVEVGGKLLAFGALALMGNFLFAFLLVALPFITAAGATPLLGFKFKVNDLFATKGLDDEQRELVRALNKQVEEVEISDEVLVKAGFAKKDDIKGQITEALKGFLNADGSVAFEMDKLKTILGEDDKGIMQIVKKLGENIKALEEQKTETAKANFADLIAKQMPEIEKVFQSKKKGVEHVFDIKAAAIMTTSNVVDGNADLPADFIESFSVGAFVPKRYAREYVFDIASRTTVANIEQYKIWLEEGTLEGGFAEVAEGGLKPLVSGDLVRNSSTATKVAAKYKYTEEFAKFRKNAFSIIQRLIRQKLLRDYANILTTLLLADAAPYTTSALDGTVAADKVTDYHAIAAVAAQIEALEFAPDVLIMNPGDKWRIAMSQDANGQFYLQIPTTSADGITRIMGYMLRTSTRVPLGTFILGESGLWEIEDEAITVRTGYGITVTGGTSNGGGDVTDVQSDLDHNRFTVIVETFFHAYIASNNEGSFVAADFDDVKAAVTI